MIVPTNRFGPPSRYWCMRFEAKHSYFKSLAQRVNNFKNICKTLAYRHQYLTCYNLAASNLAKETFYGHIR